MRCGCFPAAAPLAATSLRERPLFAGNRLDLHAVHEVAALRLLEAKGAIQAGAGAEFDSKNRKLLIKQAFAPDARRRTNTLSYYLARRPRMAQRLKTVRRHALSLLGALDLLHRHGIAHGAVSCDAVLVTAEGEACLADLRHCQFADHAMHLRGPPAAERLARFSPPEARENKCRASSDGFGPPGERSPCCMADAFGLGTVLEEYLSPSGRGGPPADSDVRGVAAALALADPRERMSIVEAYSILAGSAGELEVQPVVSLAGGLGPGQPAVGLAVGLAGDEPQQVSLCATVTRICERRGFDGAAPLARDIALRAHASRGPAAGTKLHLIACAALAYTVVDPHTRLWVHNASEEQVFVDVLEAIGFALVPPERRDIRTCQAHRA